MILILSAVASGVLGYFVASGMVDPSTPDFEGVEFAAALAIAFFSALEILFVMASVIFTFIMIGFITGSAIAAGFFARQFRLRSDQISRGRALSIALVWLVGGLLTAALYFTVLGLLTPNN